MSLINQMLRDLEQRQQVPLSSESGLTVKPAFYSKANKSPWFWLIIGMSLVASLFWYQNESHKKPVIKSDSEVQSLAIPSFVYSGDYPDSTANLDVQTVAVNHLTSKVISIDNQASKITSLIKPKHGHKHKHHKKSRSGRHHSIRPDIKSESKTNLTLDIENSAEKSVREQVVHLYHQAQTSDIPTSSRAYLEEALTLDPHYLPVRIMLLQNLLKERISSPELCEFLDNSLKLFPDELAFIKPRAHVYIQNKDFSSAIVLLERINSNTIEDQTYLALLGVSYQQLQQFKAAKDIYLRLTSVQADKAENWLGLAISYDKLNEINFAIKAYQQAFEKNTLNPQIMDYIKQRLSVLNH